MRTWVLLLSALPAAAATCESLASSLANSKTSITVAAVIPAGSFTPPAGQPIANVPAFCRVAGSLRPSGDSDIQFEVWMPASGWNGKFQGVGNGGFAGTISYSQMATALRKGYATASTDTGHKAEGGGTGAAWALGHPEKVVDFGHRAIHETAVTAKAAIAAFYGEGPKRSYFNSCSNGGRQALMEAQRYPGDYDGIIAGAPANYWTHLISNSVWVANAMTDGYIPASKLPAIEAAAVAACDAKDGVKDGVIDNPDKCAFKPSTLLCKGADSDSCLTAAQVTGLEKVLGGIRGSKGRIYPGFVVGGMPGQGGWADWITGSMPGRSLAFGFGNNFFTNIVYEDKAWDYRKFDPDRDVKKADEKTAAALNAIDSDLSKFRARGGKLILYHGWSDAAITPLNAIDYYKSIKDPSGFVELFMVPGMQHCGGGPGPNNFGQGSPGASGDAEHDINAAVEHWVEQGAAPKRLIATREGRSRPLCPWPQTAPYKGSGSTDDAANFECK
jgi:feruloyl esterase